MSSHSHPAPVDYDPFASGELVSAAPPTEPQRELWIASLAGGPDGNRAYNECLALTLHGPLDVAILRRAIAALVQRHEALRGVFSSDGEHFLVYAGGETPLAIHDLSELQAEARDARQRELERKEVETEFDLHAGPLHRSVLIRLTTDLHRFVYTAHHAACDGWSAAVLMHELAALYRAGVTGGDVTEAAAGLAPATSFIAYAAQQRARQVSAEGQQDLAYWIERLGGELTPVSLPTDRAASGERNYASRRLDIPLDPELLGRLRQTGAKAGCTFLMTFIGLVQIWLARRTGQTDIVLGVPAAGQSAAEEEALVGHCVHLLPIRMEVDLSQRFTDHLRRFKPLMLDAFDHQQVTFGSLLPRLKLPYVQGRIPLVPVCVNIDAGLGKLDFGSLRAEYETIPRAFEAFELFMNAVDHRDRLIIECSFNTALFEEATIRRWVRELAALGAAVVKNPEQALASLPLVNDEDHAAFATLNATAQPRTGTPVHQLVAQVAKQRPGATALRFGSSSLTYAELDERANRLAHVLQNSGVRVGDAVGVCLARSLDLIPALLAILKCGAAYVPLDPTFPTGRLQAMADDARIGVVITDRDSSESTPRTQIKLVLEDFTSERAAAPSHAPDVRVSPEDRAYILFTSGSTGRPKGVEVPHRAFENILLSMQRDPGFGPEDSLLAVTTISFDIAGVELFLPLVCGGCVVLCHKDQATDPSALQTLLEDRTITFMQATPATWFMLLELGWKGRAGLRVVCTGEAFPEVLRDPLLRCADAVWNMYGPTETCIYSTIEPVQPGQPITIGKPVANTSVYILDAALQLVAVGDVGEIYIAGQGVALGYVGRADLTHERFVPDPFAPGQRMYRTGDLGRLLPSGKLACLGRADSQVKIRGFRIELGEIETLLGRIPGVGRAAVVAREFGPDDLRLVAYAARERDAALDEARIAAELRAQLPPYMVPQHFVLLDQMPLSTSGKINRNALPSPLAPARTPALPAAGGTPSLDQLEGAISAVWAELLKVSSVERTASFFALGGHSLLAVRMISHLRAKLGVELSLRTVFQSPTVAALAEIVRDKLPQIPGETQAPRAPAQAAGASSSTLELDQHPNGPVITQLRAIWQTLLNVDVLDEGQSFFELGGHSMLAVRMATRVREHLGVELPLRVIFQAPTLAAIGKHVVDALSQAPAVPAVQVREEIEF